MAGLIHIYCGDGKGKTTAATGLAVRAAGAGKKVIFTQFFKKDNSSEIGVLRTIPGIECRHSDVFHGFWKNMDEKQRKETAIACEHLLEQTLAEAEKADVLILDEIISACNRGALSEERLLSFLQSKPRELEVVLTGRDPSEKLLECADYVTQMCKYKHPFDQGIKARKGIEF